jgi:hypothetical protein
MSQDDPVVQRVRETRRQITARHGTDSRALYEWAKQVEKKYQDRVVGYEPPERTSKLPGHPH